MSTFRYFDVQENIEICACDALCFVSFFVFSLFLLVRAGYVPSGELQELVVASYVPDMFDTTCVVRIPPPQLNRKNKRSNQKQTKQKKRGNDLEGTHEPHVAVSITPFFSLPCFSSFGGFLLPSQPLSLCRDPPLKPPQKKPI